MIGIGCDHLGREPYPLRGRVRTWTSATPRPARSRVPANRIFQSRMLELEEARTAARWGRPSRQCTDMGIYGRRECGPPSDSRNFKRKSPQPVFPARARLLLWWI